MSKEEEWEKDRIAELGAERYEDMLHEAREMEQEMRRGDKEHDEKGEEL